MPVPSNYAEVPQDARSVDGENSPRGVQMSGPAAEHRMRNISNEVMRKHFQCFVFVFILMIFSLVLVTMILFVVMLVVFSHHKKRERECDVPLNTFVWVNIVSLVYYFTIHVCIRCVLDPTPDVNVPPPLAAQRYQAVINLWFVTS
jgi:heme/copper-type cytochrome/quinol oxidase subunit 2